MNRFRAVGVTPCRTCGRQHLATVACSPLPSFTNAEDIQAEADRAEAEHADSALELRARVEARRAEREAARQARHEAAKRWHYDPHTGWKR